MPHTVALSLSFSGLGEVGDVADDILETEGDLVKKEEIEEIDAFDPCPLLFLLVFLSSISDAPNDEDNPVKFPVAAAVVISVGNSPRAAGQISTF